MLGPKNAHEMAAARGGSLTVLLALDGSAGSDAALELASSLDWPPGSTMRVLSVVDSFPRVVAEELPIALRETVDVAPTDTEEIKALLAGGQPGRLRVARLLRVGRPATEIVREAESCSADLVIMGSRGHGTIQSALLGSVSAEVVDMAPCSVLVARRPIAERILLAEDGSEHARPAVEALLSGSPFRGAEIRVISVAGVPPMAQAGVAPAFYRQAVDARAAAIVESTAEHEKIARSTIDRLRAAGYAADFVVPVGSPAAEIVRHAEAWADLVVLGTRGRTGLSRVILGSVARSVLLHAPCSVLVARSRTGPGRTSSSRSS